MSFSIGKKNYLKYLNRQMVHLDIVEIAPAESSVTMRAEE
jgi:hypothetical protein